MDSIQNGFNLLAWIMGAMLLLAIIAGVLYMRFKASGQERGI